MYYSFGYKPNIFNPIATDKLSLDRYREGALRRVRPCLLPDAADLDPGTILCLLIGFPFAYWLATRVTARWRGVLLGLVIVPFFVNFLIRTIGWLILLAPSGPVSTLLQNWGLRSEPLHLLQTRGAVQLGVVYNYLALMIFPLFVTLDRLDPAMRERRRISAPAGGGRSARSRSRSPLPGSSPGCSWSSSRSPVTTSRRPGARRGAREHGGRDGRDRIQHGAELGSRVCAGGHPDHHDPGHGGRVRRPRSRDADDHPRAPEDHIARGRRGVRCMSAAEVVPVKHRRDRVALRVWSVAVYVFLFLPIVVIVIYSFNNGRSILTFDGVGLEGYRTGITDPTIQDAVKTSIMV